MMYFLGTFWLFIFVFVLFILISIILILMLINKNDDLTIRFPGQTEFSAEDWESAKVLLKLIDRQEIFYAFKFSPFIDCKTGLLKGVEVNLTDIDVGGRIISQMELYEWVDRLECRQAFDISYLEWFFSYLNGFPQYIKEGLIYSLHISFMANHYDGIVKEISNFSRSVGIPCENIEIRDNLGCTDPELLISKITLANSFNMKVHWMDFGKSISSIGALVQLDFHGLTFEDSFVSRIDQNQDFKRLMYGIIRIKQGQKVRIRCIHLPNKRVVEQMKKLGVDEINSEHLFKCMYGEDLIKVFEKVNNV